MAAETPTPEQQAGLSLEQQAVEDLTTTVTDVLDTQRVATESQDDVSLVRQVSVNPHFGPTLRETTNPDGSRQYDVSWPYSQTDDRGRITRSWVVGADTVTTIQDMETSGKKVTPSADVLGIKKAKSDVESIALMLPEVRKNRVGSVIGAIATRLRRN